MLYNNINLVDSKFSFILTDLQNRYVKGATFFVLHYIFLDKDLMILFVLKGDCLVYEHLSLYKFFGRN